MFNRNLNGSQTDKRTPIRERGVPFTFERNPLSSSYGTLPNGGSEVRVSTNVVGFSIDEWRQIRQGARALEVTDADAGTFFLPGRPEVYRLDRKADHWWLRLTDMDELAETLNEERRLEGARA